MLEEETNFEWGKTIEIGERKYEVGKKSVQFGQLATHPVRCVSDGKSVYFIKDSRDFAGHPVIELVRLRLDGSQPKTKYPKLHRFTIGVRLRYVQDIGKA